ncbi:unnamed protein product [Larinioides sclopetarius]|uniref:Uncharacterized protein n=1 Tax=Larinioides sclopetarius TaxID=280406 RepID=A0AAV1ZUY3_9ARAC
MLSLYCECSYDKACCPFIYKANDSPCSPGSVENGTQLICLHVCIHSTKTRQTNSFSVHYDGLGKLIVS